MEQKQSPSGEPGGTTALFIPSGGLTFVGIERPLNASQIDSHELPSQASMHLVWIALLKPSQYGPG